MIDFNLNDFNLSKVKVQSKLGNLVTKHEYRVYGLCQANNAPILIQYSFEAFDSIKDKNLTNFLKKNNIKVEIEEIEKSHNNKIFIGLRRDLRSHILLSASILQTIIYFLEGRVDLKEDFTIKGIPRFM